jgi:hypothetical protein
VRGGECVHMHVHVHMSIRIEESRTDSQRTKRHMALILTSDRDRYSPKSSLSPVCGLRVKAVPLPLREFQLPYTMLCQLHGVMVYGKSEGGVSGGERCERGVSGGEIVLLEECRRGGERYLTCTTTAVCSATPTLLSLYV